MLIFKKCGLVLVLLFTAMFSGSALAETIWIDVRSSEEFSQGHLPGAVNIVHTEISSKIGSVTQDKNAEIKLYCRSGRRSGLAEAALKELGYTRVQNAGGYEELSAKQPKKP
jgi:phage shock protein E